MTTLLPLSSPPRRCVESPPNILHSRYNPNVVNHYTEGDASIVTNSKTSRYSVCSDADNTKSEKCISPRSNATEHTNLSIDCISTSDSILSSNESSPTNGSSYTTSTTNDGSLHRIITTKIDDIIDENERIKAEVSYAGVKYLLNYFDDESNFDQARKEMEHVFSCYRVNVRKLVIAQAATAELLVIKAYKSITGQIFRPMPTPDWEKIIIDAVISAMYLKDNKENDRFKLTFFPCVHLKNYDEMVVCAAIEASILVFTHADSLEKECKTNMLREIHLDSTDETTDPSFSQSMVSSISTLTHKRCDYEIAARAAFVVLASGGSNQSAQDCIDLSLAHASVQPTKSYSNPGKDDVEYSKRRTTKPFLRAGPCYSDSSDTASTITDHKKTRKERFDLRAGLKKSQSSSFTSASATDASYSTSTSTSSPSLSGSSSSHRHLTALEDELSYLCANENSYDCDNISKGSKENTETKENDQLKLKTSKETLASFLSSNDKAVSEVANMISSGESRKKVFEAMNECVQSKLNSNASRPESSEITSDDNMIDDKNTSYIEAMDEMNNIISSYKLERDLRFLATPVTPEKETMNVSNKNDHSGSLHKPGAKGKRNFYAAAKSAVSAMKRGGSSSSLLNGDKITKQDFCPSVEESESGAGQLMIRQKPWREMTPDEKSIHIASFVMRKNRDDRRVIGKSSGSTDPEIVAARRKKDTNAVPGTSGLDRIEVCQLSSQCISKIRGNEVEVILLNQCSR